MPANQEMTFQHMQLALEPRMMFDAAAVATAEVVAQDAQPAAESGPLQAEAAESPEVVVDAEGHSNSSADIFTNVAVAVGEDQTVSGFEVSVNSTEPGQVLVIGGKAINLQNGDSGSLDNAGDMKYSVTEKDGKFTVTIDASSIAADSLKSLIDDMSYQISDGSQIAKDAVQVRLESVTIVGQDPIAVGIETTVSIRSNYDFAPEISNSDPDGEVGRIVEPEVQEGDSVYRSDDASSLVIYRDKTADIYALKDREYVKVGTVDISSSGLSGTITSAVLSKDGTSLIIAEKHKIDNVNESSGLLIYSFKDGTFSQTAVKTFEGTALEYDSISQITVSEDGGFIALNFVYGRFFAKISNGEIASYDYDAAKLYITGNWYLKGNQLIVARTTDNEHKLEVYEFTDDMQIVRVMSEFVDFGDQVDSSSWNQGSLSPDGKTFYSVAKGQLFIYSFDLSQKSLKLIGKSDVIAGLDKSAIKEFKAGNDGVYVLGNDGSLVKYLASVGGGVTVGSEIAVNGDASLSIAADGSLLVREGTITKIYQPGYFASMGDTVSFAAGMQLSDVNLDKLNDYAGASLQFSTESGNGVFSFGADGYKLEGSYIVASNGRTIAQFSQGGGAATIQFLQGTTAADADAVLRGMSVRQSVNAPGNEVITVRFSDGTSGTPSEVETKVVFAANAVPDVTLGGSESETFTKAGTEVAVFPDVSIDLGNPGQSVQKVVIQVSGIAADSTREYLLIGDQKIALQTASQIEMGGVAYAWTVRNGVGTLTITPGAAMEAAAMEAIIEGIKYGNESAAGEAGSFAHGEHVFTIKSIQDNGGTASGGVDTAEPGVSRTLTIDVNTPPQIAFETDSASGSFSKDVYDYAGDLEGFSGYVKGVTVSDDGKTVFVTAFAGKVNTNPPTTLLVYSRDPVTGELKLSQVFNGDGAEFNGMQGTQVEGFGRIALVKMVGTDVYVTAQYTDADGKTVYCIQRFTYANGTLSNLKLLSYTNKDGLQGLDGSIDDLEVVGDRLYVATGAHYGLGYGKGETGKSIVAYQITADGLTVVQDAVQLGDNVRPIAISFSADGRYAFVAGSDKLIHVFSVNADGSLTEESGKAVTAPSTDSRTPSIYGML